MIECLNLTKFYGSVTAINDISFHLREKEFISILGPSGCGKSTLLRLIAGLEVPSQGKIFLEHKEISGKKITMPPEHRKFGMIFQDYALFPHLSVKDNIAFGLIGTKKEKLKRLEELLNLVGLPHLSENMPHQISGGEQQRIAVARALAPKPRIILMDEPFSNLDYQLRQQMRYDVRDILKHQGVASILVTHDQVEAITLSERVLLMKNGKLLQSGTPVEIYQYPQTLWASSFVGEANQLPAVWNNNSLNSPLGLINVPVEIGKKTRILMIRPEDFNIEENTDGSFNGVVKTVEFSGPKKTIGVELKSGEKVHISESPHASWSPNDPVQIKAKRFLCFNDSGERIDPFPLERT